MYNIIKNPPFNSLMWGSLRLAPIIITIVQCYSRNITCSLLLALLIVLHTCNSKDGNKLAIFSGTAPYCVILTQYLFEPPDFWASAVWVGLSGQQALLWAAQELTAVSWFVGFYLFNGKLIICLTVRLEKWCYYTWKVVSHQDSAS